MKRANRRWQTLNALVALVILLSAFSGAVAAQSPFGDSDDNDVPLEEQVVRDTAEALGWPTDVEKKPLRASNGAEETLMMLWPVERGIRYFNKPMWTVTNGGTYEEETIQWARVLNMGEEGSREFISTMVENGLPHSSYQGRDAIVMRSGDKLCHLGGLLGYVADAIKKAIEQFVKELGAEPSDVIGDQCAEADAGMIMWTCGSYVFIARDDTGQGGEDDIAAALYMAAEQSSVCELGDTLVMLAGTTDLPNSKTIADVQKMAQDANSYYGQNAYGKVVMAYTFLDADGKDGSDDGYEVGPTMAAYAGQECQFAQAAIKKAYENGAPRDEINLSRAVIVYSGKSKQGGGATFQTVCCWPGANPYWTVEVGPPGNTSKVYVTSMIMVSEEEELGSWVHEMGHSMYAKYLTYQNSYFVSDRYNYPQPWGRFGNISYWGLMGLGCLYGAKTGSAPTHMSSFEKESAEYLVYSDGELEKEYTLTALERQKAGGSILRYDDSTSADPNEFFILEARESGLAYGAPETGVVLYQVTWDATNKHHVVNAITPQKGATSANGPDGAAYFKPTLRGAGDANAPTSYKVPSRHLEFVLKSESTASGYSATVEAVPYNPANLVGAVAAPAGPPAVPPNAAPPNPRVGAHADEAGGIKVASGPGLPLPDIDLHAYDAEGRHVGLNYETGQYENQIDGAIASGDLKDAEEWIYVPKGTSVRFEVSSYKTAQFLKNSPEYADVIRPQEYKTTYQRIDASGVITEAKGDSGKLSAGEEGELEGPDAPGLNFKPARDVGYGRNLPANRWLAGLFASIGLMGLVGWVVALAKK